MSILGIYTKIFGAYIILSLVSAMRTIIFLTHHPYHFSLKKHVLDKIQDTMTSPICLHEWYLGTRAHSYLSITRRWIVSFTL